ncbi:MAG: polyprenyl diphosphate synthase [Candidatus Woesebacteria bacterium]|nr:polyprenyl diphosphate synthase [Candidatus Woesebacteria bacterium]
MSESNITLPKGTIVPNHIAIILDGNRRWARSRGLPTLEGHKAGFEAGLAIAKASRKWGVNTFTVWGLSTENWDRTPKELAYLMKLYWKMVATIEKEARKDDIRFVHLGRKDRIPKSLALYIKRIEEKTKNNKSNIFNVGIDYGGRDEIVRATQKIIKAGVKPADVTEKLLGSYMDTGDQPYPDVDLYIRTSGEQRMSGFLMWQANYAEFYWELDHLPDMTPRKLADIILDYSRRRRRFGGNDTETHLAFDPKITAKLELSWWRLKNVPEGVRIRDYAMKHIKEQFGLSSHLAVQAAKLFVEAIAEEKDEKWDKATEKMKKFYELIKSEIKLAFEPKLIAYLEVKMHKEKGENEETTKEYLSETYRISLFQAAKAAHLRVLAMVEGNRGNWIKAEDYLQKYYLALKERVA